MKKADLLRAWGYILTGRAPSVSVEITRECPLRCPGCYAYEDAHLGGVNLRQLSDFKGDELVRRMLDLADELKPLHLSIVGGDPLVRYRELETLIPQLLARGIHVQVVTSAFRQIPPAWASYDRLTTVVSIDGLQPEHDIRRAPATYERILKNIDGAKIIVHSTVTAQHMERPGYLEEFLDFWTPRNQIQRVWFSLFTPQRGASNSEILSPQHRRDFVDQMLRFRHRFPKLQMPPAMLKQFLAPPQSPGDCIFARTTSTISADLRTLVTPCQLGGDPDCAQCGCIASMTLHAVGKHKVAGFIPVGALYGASARIGEFFAKPPVPKPEAEALQPLRVLD